ncbi:MAG: GGDEF domain-containing protein [Firmicutes bacterium]|nr:GGDEF domain-containing protein [Bacillota bacterium]
MNKFIAGIQGAAVTVLIFSALFRFSFPAEGKELVLSGEEKDYLAAGKVLRAASIEGGAPLHYRDSQGEIKGIAVNILREIGETAGFELEFSLYDSIPDVLASGPDLILGLTKQYPLPGIAASNSYLESETVLFYNRKIEPSRLAHKVYAGIKGGTLPEGVREEQSVYYGNREETINAVEAGRADFGLGNAYSLAFYTLQNGYKNIITIPTGAEERAYSMGVPEGNEILLSIINKGLAAIDKTRLDALVLEVASQIERKITPAMLLDEYGAWFLTLVVSSIAALGWGVWINVGAKNEAKRENERYRILSEISNELLFEYQLESERLIVSDKFKDQIDPDKQKGKIIKELQKALRGSENGGDFASRVKTAELRLRSGEVGIFRMSFYYLRAPNGRVYSIIGKLTDISAETEEKKRLIAQAQLDGLTGLYNTVTVKKRITARLAAKAEEEKDAFMIIDCDNFKAINDTYGHWKGNMALKNVARALQRTFRQTDLLGRIGGDEFCVYLQNIASEDFISSKCRQLTECLAELNTEFPVPISIGVAAGAGPRTYEELFLAADSALYSAKKSGDSFCVINRSSPAAEQIN